MEIVGGIRMVDLIFFTSWVDSGFSHESGELGRVHEIEADYF